MRGREFLMKDGYSFDLTPSQSRESYQKIFNSYGRIFKRIGLKVIPVRAETGPIGGDLSHEFHIVAQTGESALFYDTQFDNLSSSFTFDTVQNLYAAADNQHNEKNCPIPKTSLRQTRGIEVGHIFNFGTKYSIPLEAYVTDSKGASVPVEMGSYGIGVTRVVGGIIEASHDDRGIIWPESVSPFLIGLLNLNTDNSASTEKANSLYERFQKIEEDHNILYDDRSERPGVKFADMDLMGLPYQMVISKKNCHEEKLEIKHRKTLKTIFVPEECFWNAFEKKTLSSLFRDLL